jgi:hypothetical protein
MASIPLRYRLPNPPAVFAGRETETAWIEAAFARAPVTLLFGPDGIGKSALVRHVLRRVGVAERAAYLELPPGEPNQQTRHEILRMLRALARAEEASFPAHDPEAATAAALELAESTGAIVVIDRADTTADPEFREMIQMVARFARTSRWIVTTPHAIAEAELAGQSLMLGPLSRDAMRALATAWAPGLDAPARAMAVERASGSPFFLRQWLSGAPIDHANGLLVGLSESAIALVKSMVAIEGPLSREAARIVVPHATDDAIGELERRGLAQLGPEGVHVHGVVRGLVELTRDDVERHRSLAASLARQASTPGEVIESLRLVVSAKDGALAHELLDRNAAELLRRGYAPALFRILNGSSDPRLDSFRVQCAAELGNPTALGAVETLVAEGDALARAHALFARGALEDAAREAELVLERASGEQRVAAALLLAETLQLLGRCGESAAPLAFAGDRQRAKVLALRAAAFGPTADPAVRTDELEAAAISEGDEHSLLLLAEALWALGRPSRALACVRRMSESPRGREADHLVARRARVLEARIALDAGDARGPSEAIDALGRYVRGESMIRPMLEALREDVRDLTDPSGDPRSAGARRRYRTAAGSREAVGRELGTFEHALWERAIDARRGVPRDASAPALPRLLALDRLGTGALALAGGDLAAAVGAVREGVIAAERSALYDLGAELLGLSIDAFVCARDREKAAQTLDGLRALAARIGSAAAAGDVRFYEAALEVELDLARFESLAATPGEYRAVRRARGLLGSTRTALDRVDERVLTAIRERTGVEVATVGESEPWSSGIAIDVARSTVWVNEASFDLSSRLVLFRLLAALAERGGSATKEDLVREVWNEREYHPLRHDPKLQTAVRKLRVLVERDAAAPEIVLTWEEGYGLKLPVRIVRRR